MNCCCAGQNIVIELLLQAESYFECQFCCTITIFFWIGKFPLWPFSNILNRHKKINPKKWRQNHTHPRFPRAPWNSALPSRPSRAFLRTGGAIISTMKKKEHVASQASGGRQLPAATKISQANNLRLRVNLRASTGLG
mmetsp:Transcript_98180/g.165366  ORF Transcript_98180/g.165366 Transcript_98180/m.165366 type:complete len:138 (+) Transcript_98180:297-710(+)